MNEHILIENVTPAVDGGRHPVKRIAGEPCTVEADVFRDGHEVLRAVILWRRQGDAKFSEAPLEPGVNDRWQGRFPLTENARYEFTVQAWTDVYASWLADLRKRVQVGEPIASEVHEGISLLSVFTDGAKAGAARILRSAILRLQTWVAETEAAAAAPKARPRRSAAGTRAAAAGAAAAGAAATARAETDNAAAPDLPPERAALAKQGAVALAVAEAPALLDAVAASQPRFGAKTHEPALAVVADRQRAVFGAWYEMFPRSQGTVPGRHATFADAARRLPDLARLGFDVVYLPPIHPVGTTFRKGRNNSLACEPGDPGSPWAIGSPAGGHDAVEPRLGTLADFDAFVAAAAGQGLEVALDFAIQASPDHPWVAEHPEWFYHRPDGSIKYAENPPKKYQDVYPLNFDTENRQALWDEMLRVVRHWIDHGVHIFRVDNPHTKPLVFWEWLIGTVQAEHPQVLFLSEAFTRPKLMRKLAKIGFTQSYTYFTWRNHKHEMAEYVTELAHTEMAEYFRPNFFTNTPDILHAELQTGGRPMFKIRLVLAATLSPSYGIYSGFELCESAAVPGTEEYLDSEKYEIKVRDWEAPGHIRDTVERVNRIRRDNRALQFLGNVRFLEATNDQILAYVKWDPAHENVLLVVVNMDPHHAQECTVRVPPEVLGADPPSRYEVYDLLTGARHEWGAENYVRLDPEVEPAHILRVERRPA